MSLRKSKYVCKSNAVLRIIVHWPIIVAVAFATVVGCQTKDSLSQHLAKPLPASATLVNSSSKMFGPDTSYAFEFKVTDGKLLDLLITEWRLKAVDEPCTSFSKDGPPWWPTQEELEGSGLKYVFFDEDNKVYKSVWAEEHGDTVYAEVGDW